MQVKRIIERFLSKEEKNRFFEAVAKKNMTNSKYVILLICAFEIFMICFALIDGRYVTPTHIAYFVSYVVLLLGSIGTLIFVHYSKKKDFSAKTTNAVTVAYVCLLVAWAIVISVLDSADSMQFIVYLTIIMGCSSAIRLHPLTTMFIQALSGILIIVFVSCMYKTGFLVGQSINVFVFIAISMAICVNNFNRELDDFRRKSLVEESNEQLIRLNSELNTAYDKMVKMAEEDTLTKLKNRLTLNKDFEILLEKCRGNGKPINCAMLDLDNFKQINDTYGHLFGDEVLRHIALIMESATCEKNVYRYGGEEFVIIDGHKTEQEFYDMLESIRSITEKTRLGKNEVQFTISIGICSRASIKEQSIDWLLSKADEALYASKHSGKNCINIA